MEMSYFSLAVLIALAAMTWAVGAAAVALLQLQSKFRADFAFIQRMKAKIRNDATLPYAVQKTRLHGIASGTLELLWREIEQDRYVTDETLTRIEAEVISLPIQRALSLAQIAPACGLLGTTGGIAVGLLSAQDDPSAAAEGLISALPAALLSTFVALALAIVLRMIVSGTIAHWSALRSQAMELNTPLQRVHQVQQAIDTGFRQEAMP